ncbi:MAG: IS21 family transposase [bacterium]|nr:IS21 family transposase [bacterium]
MVTDEQVRLMRRKRMEGKRQETAAAESGMSERTARKWEKGPLPSQVRKPRTWRTREDPFAEVWDSEVVGWLETDTEGQLRSTTIFDELVERYPGRFEPGQVRSLQRRVRDWRAVHGPDREVFFPQEHHPGREGAFDFTRGTSLEVRIRGQLFVHLWFVFRLSFSGWTWIDLSFGETYEALVLGLQNALWELGGVTKVGRHDNLSAATHELRKSGGRALNSRFKDVLEHLGMRSTRINPGESNENGIAEKGNDLVKKAIRQALILRGYRDFDSIEEYVAFAREAVDKKINRPLEPKLTEERKHLQPLPSCRVLACTTYHPKVMRWSTIRVANRTYSVPSRLIGHTVKVLQHPNDIEVYYDQKLVEVMPRLRGDAEARIDYRHIIWSLVRKPGAFARYRFREELFPSITFRRSYDALVEWRGERADVEYVRILHLAASTMESLVTEVLKLLLETGERFDYADVKALAKPEKPDVPAMKRLEPDLEMYDRMLGGGR